MLEKQRIESVDVTDFENQITNLNTKLKDNKKQITNLQNSNKLLQEKKIKFKSSLTITKKNCPFS